MTTISFFKRTDFLLCRSSVEPQRMGEFLMHWMILGILNDHLRLEHLDGNGSEQDALADSKQGGLLKSCFLERPVPEREHQVVCHTVQEDAHAVGVERVAGESLALHALLELA